VERWFGELTTNKLRRSSHATVKALAVDINAWTLAWNANPTVYRWVKTADAILESIASYCQRTSNSASLDDPDCGVGVCGEEVALGVDVDVEVVPCDP
jgi:hypothetical protein